MKQAARPGVDLSGVDALPEGDLLSMSSEEMRGLTFEELLALMKQVGLSTDEVECRTAALTSLMNNAYSVEAT